MSAQTSVAGGPNDPTFALSADRRPDVDWLRAFAVLLLVPFHTGLLFCDWGFFPLKTGENHEAFAYFCGILHQFHMPLLFALSGIGSWFALRKRTPGQYVEERFKRLFVPLVFGTIVIAPPQTYLQRVNEGAFNGSYLQFYPDFCKGIYPKGNLSWMHMWFVLYLFVFSLICVRLFMRIRESRDSGIRERTATLCEKRGGIFLLVIPIVLSEILLRPAFPGMQNLVWDWANFITYISYFIFGFLIMSDERFQMALDRDGGFALAFALGTLGVGIAINLLKIVPPLGYSPGSMLSQTLGAVNRWFFVLTILCYGRRFLSFSNRLLPYVSEATYPFYILHQTVICLIGFKVMRWNMSAGLRFLIICALTFAATIIIYDLFARRTNGARYLFGMKPMKRGESL
ncbi:MAG TPA: acyltransferase family protein [Candidatus Brocadiia bacterium]|nr:acyltransferase family protein [Candidatus Brocadiia bacterium]